MHAFWNQHTRLFASSSAALVFTLAPVFHAEDKNRADYLYLFMSSGGLKQRFITNDVAETKGEGRANLFENGEARGLDFDFDCAERLKTSSRFKAFPANWKKSRRNWWCRCRNLARWIDTHPASSMIRSTAKTYLRE